MKLVIISPFWNSGNLTEKTILSLKNQYYTNFTAYFIDDMSTDNSYEITKKTIGNDDRFILIKNNEKKYKTENFIDVIRNNPKISWDDVIIELDGDDELSDNFVLGRLNKVFMDENIWVCGTRWKDINGKLGNYGKPNPLKVRSTSWNFSHLRSFRAFLFRMIHDDDLKFNGEYFKAACDLGHGIPILEMCGDEHFHYIDEPLYVYKWHNKQSYSKNTEFKDATLQGRTAKHIYSLPKYPKILIENFNKVIGSEIIYEEKQPNKLIPKDFNPPNRQRKSVNSLMFAPEEKPPSQNKPKNRNEVFELKKKLLSRQSKKIESGKGKK